MSTILAASVSEPNLWVTAQNGVRTVTTTAYIPTRQLMQRLQRTLASLFLIMVWCRLSSVIGTQLANLATQLAAVSKTSIMTPANMSRPTAATRRLSDAGAWGSKTALTWRRRATAELGWAILSPAVNGVFLLLFWPGWWVLTVCLCATWWSFGR